MTSVASNQGRLFKFFGRLGECVAARVARHTLKNHN